MNKYQALADRILVFFENGIQPDSGLKHYINSTFSNPTRAELEIILNDHENCECESRLELIFFPDAAIQIKLEKIIESGCFTKNDVTLIHRLLMEKQPVTTLLFPDRESPVRFTVPNSAAKQFINRLNIHRKADSRLNDIIDSCLSEDEQGLLRVMIRNARFKCADENARFLQEFVLKLSRRRGVFITYFKIMLTLLDGSPGGNNPKQLLIAEKKKRLEAIRRAENFKLLAKGHNMETMMLQGIRTPCFDTADDMQKVAIIDDVGLAIYNQTM